MTTRMIRRDHRVANNCTAEANRTINLTARPQRSTFFRSRDNRRVTRVWLRRRPLSAPTDSNVQLPTTLELLKTKLATYPFMGFSIGNSCKLLTQAIDSFNSHDSLVTVFSLNSRNESNLEKPLCNDSNGSAFNGKFEAYLRGTKERLKELFYF